MVSITLNIPDFYELAIQALKTKKLTPSRSEFIREALVDFLREELIHYRDLDHFHEIIEHHPILTGGFI